MCGRLIVKKQQTIFGSILHNCRSFFISKSTQPILDLLFKFFWCVCYLRLHMYYIYIYYTRMLIPAFYMCVLYFVFSLIHFIFNLQCTFILNMSMCIVIITSLLLFRIAFFIRKKKQYRKWSQRLILPCFHIIPINFFSLP